MKFSIVSLLALAASSVSYAAVLDTCTIALAGLVSDPGLNACLPLAQGAPLVTGNITTALVQNVTAAFCPMPACSDASISLIQKTVLASCVTNDTATSQVVYGIASLYPPLKSGLCTSVGTGNSTYCTTVLAQSLLTYIAANPSPLGSSIFSNTTVLGGYVDAMPTSILCTACNKAMISPIVSYVKTNRATLQSTITQWSDLLQAGVQKKCGSSFTDGSSTFTAPSGGSSAAVFSKQLDVAALMGTSAFASLMALMLNA